MRRIAVLIIASLATPTAALADDCRDSFIALMTDRTTKEPTKILVTQEIKGGMKTVNWNYQDGQGNWLTEMVEPENAQWSMGLDNVLYSSTDQGKTWVKVRDMEEQNDDHQKSLDERAATVKNPICGKADLDGIAHRTIQADYKMLGSFDADINDKFWVNAETGYVTRLDTQMKSAAFESSITQVMEPAPDLKMPNPQ